MSKSYSIKKGLDIRLKGQAEPRTEKAPLAEMYALIPDDFHGVIPKMSVKPGDPVKAGSVIFTDKANPRVAFSSPVSGAVSDVVRGDKRKILRVTIKPDGLNQYQDFGTVNSSNAPALLEALLSSGLWALIRQRPFDVIPAPDSKPKGIIVTAFDSAPLAGDFDYVLEGRFAELESGLRALVTLAEGAPVWFNRRTGSNLNPNITGVEVNEFNGPHPSGNAGVQLHAISPINKGEVYWTLDAVLVAAIGRFVISGRVDLSSKIALAGSEVAEPKYWDMIPGAMINSVIGGQILTENVRIISGNVLTGRKEGKSGFLGMTHRQITIVPEGNVPKFFLTDGWMGAGFDKFSASGAFPTKFMPKSKKWRLDTNQNGEERAFVVTGQYEKVFPFDIYPVHLVKAAITNDLDGLENLGIYEVAPEDFALCEYVCTSKINSQEVIREALDLVQRECI